ncbi:MAG: universal stress protein [Desulfuromonadales bacterium]|nr:universal stress protein [Desulfuromonadales bacterium]
MRKVLFAVDCSPASKSAAEYLATVAPHLPGCEVTLFSVMTGIPYDSRELEKLSGVPIEVHGGEDHQQEVQQVQNFFQEITTLLVDNGFPAAQLQTSAKPLRRGVALDIIDEALEQECDTIVVGRRGLTLVQEMLQGSVSHDLMHKAPLALWVIGERP